MKIRTASALIAGLMLSVAPQAMAQTKPAAAPAASGIVAPGIGIVNPQAIIASSNAFRTAQQQRPVTYKPQIDQANTRATAIQAQLKPMADKFEADRKAPTAAANQAALQAQVRQIQQLQQSGQEEINRILAPVALSEAYVEEQVNDQLDKAVQQAAAKRKISLVLTPETVLYAEAAYNLNQDVLNELNGMFPAAQLVPPAGWMPRAQRDQLAQQQAAQGQQQQQQPATKQPAGR